ncbi:MAG: alpha/beta hydrolase [Deltaproteobacteria bacterium]|nr:alpha/beta hydrolase [Deltaproteobacteria bacterium]
MEPRIIHLGATKHYNHLFASFNSPYEGCTKDTATILCDVFEPKNMKADHAILFVHGIGDMALRALEWFPKAFARTGVPCFFIRLPYIGIRTPKGEKSGEIFIKADVEKVFKAFSHSVVDIRQTITVMLTRYKSVSIVGYSLGGMLSIIAMAMDKRIEKGVFILSGGNFFHIDWKSPATRRLRKEYKLMDKTHIPCGTEKGCARIHKGMYEFIESISLIEDLLNSDKYLCYKYDPVFFAPFLRGRQVCMINAIFDRIFPFEAVCDLWHAMGKPPIFKIPSGHITSIIFRRQIAEKTIGFIAFG